jgi:four helix bundle protein
MELEGLKVWQLARKFRIDIRELVKSYPNEEKFRLTDQILRSSRSISANIAEGYGRFHYQDNIQFCRMARGSLIETLDHLYVSLDENYITQFEFDKSKEAFDELKKVLNGYIAYLQKRKQS